MTTAYATGTLLFGLFFALIAAALFTWRQLSRAQRPPVEFKLLRGPGELTLRQLRRLETRLPATLLVAVLLPILLGFALLLYVPLLVGFAQFAIAIVGWLGWGAAVYFIGRYVHQQLQLRRMLALRYVGERAIAEELSPLLTEGFRFFHDVAIHGADSSVDLDLVIVGPNGVTVLEAETREREKGPDAHRDHEVTFDGKHLLWPWGADRGTVASIESETASFSKWLVQTTGYRITAYPLLTIPGWWVNITGPGLVNVVNHKQVLHAVTERTEIQLEPEQIEKICRELELHCRDVEA